MKYRSLGVAVCMVALVPACGGDEDTTAGGAATTTTTSGGGGVGAEGGGGGGATGGAGGAVPNEAPVLLTFGNDIEWGSHWASFTSGLHSDPTRRGHVVVLNEQCFLSDDRVAGHDPTAPTGLSPGLVTIAGGSLADMTLDPEADGADYAQTTGQWEAGDVLTASAPGDALEGFALTRTMPTELVLISPDLLAADDDEIHVDLAVPYEITWTPNDGTVLVELDQGLEPEGPGAVHVLCLFSGTSGEATLPVEVLAELQADTTETTTRLGIGLFAYEEATLGGRPFLAMAGDWRDRNVIAE